MVDKIPKVSLVILTTNTLKMTEEVLDYIAGLEIKNLKAELILADNGSKDGTEEVLMNTKLPNMNFKFIQNGGNMGFAGGNNTAIKYALDNGADYIVLLNNDVILKKDLLVKLVEVAESDKRIGLISPKMYFAKGYEFHKERYKQGELGKVFWYAGGIIDKDNVYSTHRGVDEVDRGQFNEMQETDFANGACVLIRKEVFQKIGMLDKSFFLYWEDADFSERAKKAGFKVVYYPGTCIWHKVSVSTGGSGSPSNDYFLIRNRYYYAMKYMSLKTKLAILRDTTKIAFTGRTWQKKGAFDALLGIKGMGAWAKR